jgi:nitrous oxidase accessory protein NosD
MKTSIFVAIFFFLPISRSNAFSQSPVLQGGASVINVTDAPFNAYRDGTHPRETAKAINDAIDSAALSGKTVYLPQGIYAVAYFGTEITYGGIRLRPGTVLLGDSGKSIIRRVKVNGQTDGLAVSINLEALSTDVKKNNFTVRNLVVEGATGGRRSGLQPGTGSDGGVSLSSPKGENNALNKVIIENVIVRNTNKEAILVWFANEVEIRNCTVTNCNFDAYNPAGIDLLLMENNTSDSVEYAVEYYGGGLRFHRNESRTISSATIRNNTFRNVFKAGIRIFGGDEVLIQNNIISGVQDQSQLEGESDGILVRPGHSVLRKLTIAGNTISFSNYFGISVTSNPGDFDGSTSITITKNQIANSGVNAIQVIPKNPVALWKLQIDNNVITDWNRLSAGNSLPQAALSLSKVDSFIVEKNRIRNDNKAAGNRNPVFVTNTNGGTIKDNDFTEDSGNVKVSASSKLNPGLKVSNNKGSTGYYDYEISKIVPEKEK